MGASRLALEELLESGRLVSGKAGAGLLSGLGARLTRASELARPATSGAPPALSLPSTEPLERLLGGLPRGKLIEIVGRRTSGRHSLAIAALASVTSGGEPAALVDPGDHFDPQAAEAAGVDLERVLWVRPAKLKAALASAEMLLATGFPLVVADLGLSARGSRFLPDAVWVRLGRAAQSQGACLLIVTPWRMTGIAAEAVVTADIARPCWLGAGKSPRLLEGMTSNLHLEKWGRATPGTSAPVTLRAPEAIETRESGESGETENEKRETREELLSPIRPARPLLPPLPAGEGRGEGRISSPSSRSSDPIPLTDHPITRSPDHPIPALPPLPAGEGRGEGRVPSLSPSSSSLRSSAHPIPLIDHPITRPPDHPILSVDHPILTTRQNRGCA